MSSMDIILTTQPLVYAVENYATDNFIVIL